MRKRTFTQWMKGAAMGITLLGWAACASDTGLDMPTGNEDTEWGEVEIGMSAWTETRATDQPITPEEAATFLITAWKGEEIVRGPIALGSMDKRFPAGQGYKLSAESVTEADAESGNNGWGQKRFTGESEEFAVAKGETTKVTIPMSVANGAMCVVPSKALKEFYTESCTVKLTDTDRGLTWTYDNMGQAAETEGGEVTDGQVAYFNIPASGTRTIHYTITASNGTKNTTSEGDLTLQVAKMKRLNLTYTPGYFSLEIQVDDTDLYYDSSIIIGSDDVTSDDGQTDANSGHDNFNTDGTDPDYDEYN